MVSASVHHDRVIAGVEVHAVAGDRLADPAHVRAVPQLSAHSGSLHRQWDENRACRTVLVFVTMLIAMEVTTWVIC